MVEGWLRHRWASEAHAETLAKIDLAMLFVAALAVCAFAFR